MTNIIECDRCGSHVKSAHTLWYMKKNSQTDLGDMLLRDFIGDLNAFHYCQDCQEFVDRDFPAVLKKK